MTKKKPNKPTTHLVLSKLLLQFWEYKVNKSIRNILSELLLKKVKIRQTLRNSQCSIYSQSDICVLLCPIDNRIICP